MSDNIYILYETTNLVNGKFYIGVHKQEGTNFSHSEATKKKISKALTGIKRSEKTKEKIRLASIGIPLSTEHKLSIQKAHRKTIWVINGNIYYSCREAKSGEKIGIDKLYNMINDPNKIDCYRTKLNKEKND